MSYVKALMYCPECDREYPEEHREFVTVCHSCNSPRPLTRNQIVKALKLGLPIARVIQPLMFGSSEIQDYDISSIYDSLLELKEEIYSKEFRKDHSQKECEALARLIASNRLKSLTFDGSFEHGDCLADALKNVTSIESLEVTRTNGGLEHIAAGIRGNKSITRLSIYDAPQPEASDPLFKAIESNTAIQTLSVYEMPEISSKTMEAMKQMFIGNTTLASIDFTRVVSSCGWKLFAEGLKANRGCSSLSLRECNVDRADMEPILDALETHPTITRLELISIPLKDGYTSLNKVLKNNTTMTAINLSGACLEVKGLNGLANGIRSNKALKMFDIDIKVPEDQWQQSNEGIKPFFSAIKENSRLEQLSFHGFAGSDDEAKCIIDSLTDHKSLNIIDISYNTFSKETVQFLGSRLKNNTQIKYINFTMPTNEPEMYDMTADIIRSNKKLMSININNCRPSYEDFDKICSALKENETLTNIRMGEEFDDQPAPRNAVLDLFTVNYSLTWISLVRHHDFTAFLQRNKDYQKEKYQDTAVLLHNIGRNMHASEVLPIEIWILIFKFLKYPGFSSFEKLAKRILLSGRY